MADPYHLSRFVDAQAPVYERVTRELQAGRKASHWMWYVFPQWQGLGWSPTARYYGISSLDEARAYLVHPILGPRLDQCVHLVLALDGRTAEQIFGYPDVLKFRSCLSLFAAAAPDPKPFIQALSKYYGGEPDPATIERLGQV